MDTLRPDDHFLILLESDETPMHIGSLLLLDASTVDPRVAAERLRALLCERLPATPLLRILRSAPLSFDSDAWLPVDAADIDFDQHVVIHRSDAPMTDRDLRAFVAKQVMIRLHLDRPPFAIHILPDVGGARIAVYIKMHHCVTDGVGFQTLLGLLSDDADERGVIVADIAAQGMPTRHEWLAASVRDFRASRANASVAAQRRTAALAALRDPALQRPLTPVLSISGPTSTRRAYATVSLAFNELIQTARTLDATVNDLFLASVGGAIREYLMQRDDLPDLSLTTNSARSYRRPEHGLFGNRIVAIHPHLATHLAAPLERLRSIQESMAFERRRTVYDELLLDQAEIPFGPRIRRQRFAVRRTSSAPVLPGNVTVSNVPGPAHARSYAGMSQISNHPTPLLGNGRALNFTARRNGTAFDVGVMADPDKVADIEGVIALFVEAYAEYRNVSLSRSDQP